MADTKISAMTAATEVKNLDEFPIVDAGANFKANKLMFLTAAAGEHISITGDAAGSVFVQDAAMTSGMQVDNVGNVTETSQAQHIWSATGTSGTFSIVADMNAPGASITSPVPLFITYVPAAPLNWALPIPADLALAIDRLVAAVVARTIGGPV